MQLIPAIDLLAGVCVRLTGGDYNAVQVYDKDPAAVARRFFTAGATRLHVVDLDAAKAGVPVNIVSIEKILSVAAECGGEVEIGGGLRTAAAVRDILAVGAHYAIVGTAAVHDAEFRCCISRAHPGQIIVAVDVRAGSVAVSGWCKDSGIREEAFIAGLRDTPPAALIYTDISRDGKLTGVNAAATAAVAAQAPCPVIASGGVRDLDDLRALATYPNISGVVIGRAIYNGTLSLSEALACFR